MPPAVGRAAAISAIDKLTMNDSPPTIVQFANAAVGPPVYMTKPNKTGIPDAKFMLCSGISGSFSDWNLIYLTVKVAALHIVSMYLSFQFGQASSNLPVLKQTKTSKKFLLVSQLC
jgi:hypothetical protein